MGTTWYRCKEVDCDDERDCFAKSFTGYCTLLTEAYPAGECPFYKPRPTTYGDLHKLEKDQLVQLTDFATGLDLRTESA